MVNKILYRKWLFEQKLKKWSTKYYTENDYLSKKTNNVKKILYRKWLFEQKNKQWSKKYYTENDYLSKKTNNGQQNTIQRTTIWDKKKQTMVSKILYRKWLFEQKHKQWSTKYYTENYYLSKNTNNDQQNTIQKTTIWAKTQTRVNKILYRELLFEQKHKQWSAKYYTENDYLIVFVWPLFVFLLKK